MQVKAITVGPAQRGEQSRTAPSPRWAVLRGIVLVAVAGYLSYWLAHQYFGPHHDQFDLKIYYRAIKFWVAGNDIYAFAQPDPVNISLGFTYPPLAAVLMLPMAQLSFPVVRTIMLVTTVLATAGCVFLCLRERLRIRRHQLLTSVGVATAAAFLLEPIRQTLGFGQINMFLMLLILLDVFVLARSGSRWTGVGIGLAMAIKITPGVFLLYLLLSKQQRAAVVAVTTAAVATLVSGLVAPAQTWEYYTKLLWESDRVGFLGGSANQSLNGLIARFSAPLPPSHLIWLVAVLAVGIPAAWRIRSACRSGDTLAAVTLTGLLGVLVSPASWTHHVVWVIPAMIIIGQRMLTIHRDVRPGRTAGQWLALHAPIALLAIGAVMAWGIDLRINLGLPDVDYSGYGVLSKLLGSVPMFWCVAAVFLLPVRASRKARPMRRDDLELVTAEPLERITAGRS